MFVLTSTDQSSHIEITVLHIAKSHRYVMCAKKFSFSKSSLTNHMRKHTGTKDICSNEDCGKSFASWRKYLEHIQYAHLETKTCQCHMCAEFFQNSFQSPLPLGKCTLHIPEGCQAKEMKCSLFSFFVLSEPLYEILLVE